MEKLRALRWADRKPRALFARLLGGEYPQSKPDEAQKPQQRGSEGFHRQQESRHPQLRSEAHTRPPRLEPHSESHAEHLEITLASFYDD